MKFNARVGTMTTNPAPNYRNWVIPAALGYAAMAGNNYRRYGGPNIPVFGNGGSMKPKFVQPGSSQSVTGRRPSKFPSGGGSGAIYAGKFKRRAKKRRRIGRRRKTKKKPTMGHCISKGVSRTTEVTGTLSDPDCCYIGHAAVVPVTFINEMAKVVMKKLFQRAGISVTNWDDVFPDMSPTASDIIIHIYSADGTSYGTPGTFTSGTDTFSSICQTLNTAFFQYSHNTNIADQTVMLKRVTLSYVPSTGVQNLQSTVYLDEETVHFVVHSRMKVQNRTLSSGSSPSGDAENVANNPLEGKLYDFDRVPKTSVDWLTPLQLWNYDYGTIKVGAAAFNAKAQAKEPPSGRLFTNVKKTTKIILQPGQMKESVIYYTISKKVNSVLIWCQNYYDASAYTNKFPGPCQVIALEDVININASESISIAFEVNRKIGCYLTSKRISSTQSAYVSAALA